MYKFYEFSENNRPLQRRLRFEAMFDFTLSRNYYLLSSKVDNFSKKKKCQNTKSQLCF